MRVNVTFTTAGSAARPRRRTVEADVLHLGRESNIEIQLLDPRIAQRHALIERSPLGYILRAVGSATLGAGSGNSERMVLVPGASGAIGPYRVTVGQPDEGVDLDLTIELVQPLAEDDDLAVKRLLSSLSSWMPSTRRLSWAAVLSMLLLAATLPLAGWISERPTPHAPMANAAADDAGMLGGMPARLLASFWSVGTMSNAHRSFGLQCAMCHEKPFAPVATETCLNCHEYIAQHADPHVFPVVDLARQSCEDCHLEHKGEQSPIRRDQSFCVDCHGNMHETVARARVADVASFADHPQFRAQIVADPAKGTLRRISLDARVPPTNKSNLIFSHAVHLDAKGILSSDGGKVQLDCGSCHVVEPGGGRMKPIRMEEQCQGCHDLRFEPRHPEWVLPHGSPDKVIETITTHYSQMALAGEAAGIVPNGLVMRPGAPGPSEAQAADWARDRTLEVLGTTFSKSACGYCHQVEPPSGNDPLAWTVAPVLVPTSFFPKAQFSHSAHATQPCEQCHDSRHSEEGSPVKLPSIAICRNCHADEGSAPSHVASSCSFCHAYHGPESAMPKLTDRKAAR